MRTGSAVRDEDHPFYGPRPARQARDWQASMVRGYPGLQAARLINIGTEGAEFVKFFKIVRYAMHLFRLMTRIGLWTFASFFGLCAQASEPAPPDDRAAVRLVIEAQLAAFAADDAEQAFSHASPSIQATFITARNFLDMVRIAYPVVYRPASLRFQVPVLSNEEVWQTVQMRDASGMDWTALYTLKRQADGVWKISGCALQRSADQNV